VWVRIDARRVLADAFLRHLQILVSLQIDPLVAAAHEALNDLQPQIESRSRLN
jgi:hypothetical protein